MREFVGNVSTKGQVTLPTEMRRLLGIRPGDKVRMAVEDKKIVVRPAEVSLDAAYRSIPPLKRKMSVDQMNKIAAEEAAQKFVRDLDAD